MIEKSVSDSIHRITILWALTECGLGGFFHALQSPFTGLFVGGLAVVYISLIAYFTLQEQMGLPWKRRAVSISRNLSSSLIFVLVVKAIVSPHSPPAAYFAVSIQVILGIVFFTLIPYFKLAAILTSVIATTLSAIQKVVILTILFGMSLYDAIDQFVLTIAEKLSWWNIDESSSASFWLALTFVMIYAFGGLFIGIGITSIPSKLEKNASQISQLTEQFQFQHSEKSRKARNRSLIYGGMALVFLLEYFFLSEKTAFGQLLRTALVLTIWLFLLQPILRFLISKWAFKRFERFTEGIAEVQIALPKYAAFSKFAWKKSKEITGYRIHNFVVILIHFGIHGK